MVTKGCIYSGWWYYRTELVSSCFPWESPVCILQLHTNNERFRLGKKMWFEIPTIFLNVYPTNLTNLLFIQNLSILMMLVSENYLFYKIIDPFRWCICFLTVTLWESLVEQELLTFPEHPSSPPLFTGVCVAQSLVLCVLVLFITVYPSVLFLLAIILSEIMYLKFQRKTKQTYDCPGFPL